MHTLNDETRKITPKRFPFPILMRIFPLALAVALVFLTGCSPVSPSALTQTADLAGTPDPTRTTTPAPTASATDIPPTITPSPTATPPFSPTVVQAIRDAFNCATNNLIFSPTAKLTEYCAGYWTGSWSNVHDLDGVLLRSALEPYLTPLDNLRWRLTGISDVQMDERYSTKVSQIYTATLSTALSGDVTLACPSGTPAPFQTTVNIPITGQARIIVYSYLDQPQETVHIDSFAVKGNPLQDYCASLH